MLCDEASAKTLGAPVLKTACGGVPVAPAEDSPSGSNAPNVAPVPSVGNTTATAAPRLDHPCSASSSVPPSDASWLRCCWRRISRAMDNASGSLSWHRGNLRCNQSRWSRYMSTPQVVKLTDWLHRRYLSLPTTRACAWMLPQESGATLVVHLALVLVSLEVLQATSFYVRYRHAAQASAAAMKGTTADSAEDEDNANVEDHDKFSNSVSGCTAPASPSPETPTARVSGRTRLPHGSSRALRRLCRYWVMIEKAVQAAPQKRAGVPTTAAELGRFFRIAFVGGKPHLKGAAEAGACSRLTSDGVPQGATMVLVLPDATAFPVMRCCAGRAIHLPFPPPTSSASTTTTTTATPTIAEESAEVMEPWRTLHHLWTDVVRYAVNYVELRQLLLGCTVNEIAKLFELGSRTDGEGGGTQVAYSAHRAWRSVLRACQGRSASVDAMGHFSDAVIDSPIRSSPSESLSAHSTASPNSRSVSTPRSGDPRVAVASMALTWYLAVVREVYEAVVIHEDVQRCAAAVEELQEYNRAIYQHGIEVSVTCFEESLCACPDGGSDTGRSGEKHHQSRSGKVKDAPGLHKADDAGDNGVDPLRCAPVPPRPLPQVVSTLGGGTAITRPAGSTLPSREAPPTGTNPLDDDTEAVARFPFPATGSPSPEDSRGSHGAVLHVRVASPRACWAELTAALAALLRRRRLMELAHVRSLFAYMYTGSAAKLVSFAVLALLTSLTSRVAAVGLAGREAISSSLDTYYRLHNEQDVASGGQTGPSDMSRDGIDSEGRCGVPAHQRVIALCAFECVRLTINMVLTQTTDEYIAVAASRRRNTVKAELYEALTRLPLAFFELHSYEEVEQMVYYVNDIEGVEVHAHQYICRLVTSLLAMRRAMHHLPHRARLLVGATVAVALAVKVVGRRVKAWAATAQRTGGALPSWLRGCNLSGTAAVTTELDAQVEENTESNVRQGGVMLRGLDIVAVLPQLRPYGADLSLMRWWTDHTRACGAALGATEATTFMQGLLVLPLQAYGKLLPAFGSGLLTFSDWVLPTLVASYGASMASCSVSALQLSNRLMETMRCVDDAIDTLVDGRRVVEVLLLNAYKANVLEKVFDRRRWEPTSAVYACGTDFHGRDDGDEESADFDGERVSTEKAGGPLPRHEHKRRLLRSFSRASLRTVAMRSPPTYLRCWRAARRGTLWCFAHAPPIVVLRGAAAVARNGLAYLGFSTAAVPRRCSSTSRLADSRDHRAYRPRHRLRQRSRSREREGAHRQRRRGTSPGATRSMSDGTEVYQSDRGSEGNGKEMGDDECSRGGSDRGKEDDRSSVEDVDRSSSSSSGSTTTTTTIAVAAAEAVLANATVGAVTVQHLQFHYPTAPTVPVFTKPLTFTFELQNTVAAPTADRPLSRGNKRRSSSSSGTPAASPEIASPVQVSEKGRGRLVCLVGPSGHGKSTLLSLLLGLYTHYDVAEEEEGSPTDSPGESGKEGDTVTGESPVGTADAAETMGGVEEAKERPFASTPVERTPSIYLTLALPQTPAASLEATATHSSPRASPASHLDSSVSNAVLERLPVASIPRDILRGSLFSFVPQSPIIFSGATIAHNISLKNAVSLADEALLADITQCATWAHCDFVQRFPQGLMTYLTDSGAGAWSSSLASASAGGGGSGGGGSGGGGGAVRLSGGQAQRLMVARALFHGRHGGTVLIMDEPTASLDKKMKLEILKEWRGLLDRGVVRGMICATHDDDLINMADEVVSLP